MNLLSIVRYQRAIERGIRARRESVVVDRVASHRYGGKLGEEDEHGAKIEYLDTRHCYSLSRCVGPESLFLVVKKKGVQRGVRGLVTCLDLVDRSCYVDVEEETAFISAGELPFHIG